MLLSPPFHLTVGRRLHKHKRKINGFSRTFSELDVAKFPWITAAQTPRRVMTTLSIKQGLFHSHRLRISVSFVSKQRCLCHICLGHHWDIREELLATGITGFLTQSCGPASPCQNRLCFDSCSFTQGKLPPGIFCLPWKESGVVLSEEIVAVAPLMWAGKSNGLGFLCHIIKSGQGRGRTGWRSSPPTLQAEQHFGTLRLNLPSGDLLLAWQCFPVASVCWNSGSEWPGEAHWGGSPCLTLFAVMPGMVAGLGLWGMCPFGAQSPEGTLKCWSKGRALLL